MVNGLKLDTQYRAVRGRRKQSPAGQARLDAAVSQATPFEGSGLRDYLMSMVKVSIICARKNLKLNFAIFGSLDVLTLHFSFKLSL